MLSLDAGFLRKVWDRIKRLFDLLWIATYPMTRGMVILIIILSVSHSTSAGSTP